MPEITDAEYRQFVRYQGLGTPEELERLSKKVSELETDNKKQRDTIRELRDQVPEDGTVAVAKDDAEALERYKALGELDALEEAVKERDSLRADVATRDRRDAMREAVEAAGWPVEVVATLEDMSSLQGAAFEVEVSKNDEGEEVRTPYITLEGDDAEKQDLTAFAAKHPALQGLRTEAGAPEEEEAPRYPTQPKDGGDPKPDTAGGVDDMIQQMQERARAPNALRPNRQT